MLDGRQWTTGVAKKSGKHTNYVRKPAKFFARAFCPIIYSRSTDLPNKRDTNGYILATQLLLYRVYNTEKLGILSPVLTSKTNIYCNCRKRQIFHSRLNISFRDIYCFRVYSAGCVKFMSRHADEREFSP